MLKNGQLLLHESLALREFGTQQKIQFYGASLVVSSYTVRDYRIQKSVCMSHFKNTFCYSEQ